MLSVIITQALEQYIHALLFLTIKLLSLFLVFSSVHHCVCKYLSLNLQVCPTISMEKEKVGEILIDEKKY